MEAMAAAVVAAVDVTVAVEAAVAVGSRGGATGGFEVGNPLHQKLRFAHERLYTTRVEINFDMF